MPGNFFARLPKAPESGKNPRFRRFWISVIPEMAGFAFRPAASAGFAG